MLYVTNIQFWIQLSFPFDFFFHLRGESIRPPLPIFLGGRGGKKCTGGLGGVHTLMFVDLYQINAYIGSDIALVRFFIFSTDSPLKYGISPH